MCIGLGHHHRLAEESFRQHCAEQYRVLHPIAAALGVVGRNLVFIKGAILSRLVEVYIGLRMCRCMIWTSNTVHSAAEQATTVKACRSMP